MQDLLTNKFLLDGKIKQSVAGVSENGRKKMFLIARKSVSASRNKVIFKKLNFSYGFISRKRMQNLFKNTFLLEEQTAYGRNI